MLSNPLPIEDEDQSMNSDPFKHFLDNSFNLIWIINDSGQLWYANPAWHQALGYLSTDLPDCDIYTLLHPATYPKYQEAITQVLQGQSVRNIEISLVKKDGQAIIIAGDIYPHQQANKIIGAQFIFADITSQRIVEEKLQLAERHLQYVLNYIDEVFYLYDVTNEKFLHVNPAYERVFGRPVSELEENPFVAFLKHLHPEDYDLVVKNISQSAQQPGAFNADYRIIRPDGQVRWVTDTTYAIEDHTQNVYKKIGIITDITARKALEKSLRQLATRLQVINDASRSLLAAHSIQSIANTMLSHLNDLVSFQQAQIFRYDSQTGVTHSIADTGEAFTIFTLGEHIAYSLSKDHGRSQNLQIHYIENVSNQSPSLPFYQELLQTGIHAFVLVLLVVEGVVEGILFIGFDKPRAYDQNTRQMIQELAELLTMAFQQAYLRESLDTYAETLEALVATRTYELQMTNQELIQANRLKDEFLAAMSHELSTPLTNILARTEVLQELNFGPLNEKQLYFLQAIERSGNRLLDLINDIFDLAKINAGQIELQPVPVSLDLICESSLSMIRETAVNRHITIEEAYSSGLILMLDGQRLQQVLTHLLNNAVKFTPINGSIGLTVTTDAAQQEIYISVWDTGIGIPTTQLQNLFKPFLQLDGGLTRRHEGVGLGLVLVERLTELLGGKCSVISKVDIGSTFTITFPFSMLKQGFS